MMFRQMQSAGFPMPPFRPPFMYPPHPSHMMPPGAVMSFQELSASMGMHAPAPLAPPPSSQVFDLKTIENHINQLLKGGNEAKEGEGEARQEAKEGESENTKGQQEKEEPNTLPAILSQVSNQLPHMMPYPMHLPMWMQTPQMMPPPQHILQRPHDQTQELAGNSRGGSNQSTGHGGNNNRHNNSRNDDDGNYKRRNNNPRYRRSKKMKRRNMKEKDNLYQLNRKHNQQRIYRLLQQNNQAILWSTHPLHPLLRST
eukprot:TRINITY_DN2369_c0_g2_i1.p1 TRINITY_DN2369_c0_g2~~TRINITY_DN2369_c0_g2_i1.p1  ORF type:complete len:256 (+),score=57.96 TRINITY_DN2369_c0_g2_i1:365-1132(+)